jgi:hypothetical protein
MAIMAASSAASAAYSASQKSPNYGGQAAAQEAQRQGLINQGSSAIDSAFSGFTPDFYKQRQQAYVDYAMPQLSQQYNQTKNQIGYSLANRGMTPSSLTGQQQFSNLDQQMALQKQNVVDTGISQAQGLQSQILGQKNTLLNQLYQSTDPTAAGQSATQYAATMSQPSSYTPLSNVFSNLVNQYYTAQLLNNYKSPAYNLPSSGTNASGALPQAVVNS